MTTTTSSGSHHLSQNSWISSVNVERDSPLAVQFFFGMDACLLKPIPRNSVNEIRSERWAHTRYFRQTSFLNSAANIPSPQLEMVDQDILPVQDGRFGRGFEMASQDCRTLSDGYTMLVRR